MTRRRLAPINPYTAATATLPPAKPKRELRPTWHYIAGLRVEPSGEIAVVWLADDREKTSRIYLVDCAKFAPGTQLAVVADGINSRLRGWKVPIAYEKSAEPIAAELRRLGCRMLAPGYEETPQQADVTAREITALMLADRWTILEDCPSVEWRREGKSSVREYGEPVKLEGFPLMSATRHAVHHRKRAQRLEPTRPKKIDYSPQGVV